MNVAAAKTSAETRRNMPKKSRKLPPGGFVPPNEAARIAAVGSLVGLPLEMADDVVESVVELLSGDEDANAWHGGCLALPCCRAAHARALRP